MVLVDADPLESVVARSADAVMPVKISIMNDTLVDSSANLIKLGLFSIAQLSGVAWRKGVSTCRRETIDRNVHVFSDGSYHGRTTFTKHRAPIGAIRVCY